MKQYNVIFSPRAEQQLGSLYAYIAEHGGEERAEHYIRDFFTITPQLEHSCEVYKGFTAIVILLNTLAKYSNQTLN